MKGKLKDYNNWLKTEVSDYVLPTREDKLFRLSLADSPQKLVTYEAKKHTKKTGQKKVKIPDWDPLPFFRALFEMENPRKFFTFFKLKDILNCIQTCKTFMHFFSSRLVWQHFCNWLYHNPQGAILKTPSLKDLYRYELQKTLVPNQTGLFLRISNPKANKIVQTLADSMSINPNIRTQIQIEVRSDVSDWKLSLDKEQNQICLWTSKVVSRNCQKGVGFCNSHTELRPTISILKILRFPEEKQIINSSFFGDRYLLIETEEDMSIQPKENDDLDEDESQSIDDLNNEQNKSIFKKRTFDLLNLLHFKSSEGGPDDFESEFSFEFCSCKNLEEEEKELKQSRFVEKENGFTFNYYPVTGQEGQICVKTLTSGELLFFLKSASLSFLIIFDLKSKKLICKHELKFKEFLFDLVPIQTGVDENSFAFFAIDCFSNVFSIKCTRDGELEINEIDLSVPELTEYPKPIQHFKSERFPNAQRYYYQGSFQKDLREPKVNYLVVFKNAIFQFIDTESLQVHRCTFRYPKFQLMYDWNIYNNMIYIVTDNELQIFKIRFNEFPLSQVSQINTYRKPRTLYGQWIFISDTYIVLISSSSFFLKDIQQLEVVVASNQTIFSQNYLYYYGIERENLYTYFLGNMLSKAAKLEVPYQFLAEDLKMKFENSRLLVRGSEFGFFLDLTGGFPATYQCRSSCYGSKSSQIQFRLPMEERKELVEENKREFVIANKKLLSINNTKKKYPTWKNCEKKIEDKEEREEDRVVRKKGRRYYKNIRQIESQNKQT